MHDKVRNKNGEEKIMEFRLKCCETSLRGDVGMHDDLIKKSIEVIEMKILHNLKG